jgi:hypothetical protein
VRAYASEGEGSDESKTSKLRTFLLQQRAGSATMTFPHPHGKTSKLRTFCNLVTMLQNTPNLLQKPVTQLFGKSPPKSNTKRFKNSEREREIDIIYIYVTL